MKAITGSMQMFSTLILGCDPRALDEALRDLPREDLEKIAAKINSALAAPCRQKGDSDRCIGCGNEAADFCAAQCVGPLHESGCGEALWLCTECARRDTNAYDAIRDFNAKHAGHVPAEPTETPRPQLLSPEAFDLVEHLELCDDCRVRGVAQCADVEAHMGAVMMARPAALAQPEAGCCERTLARAETVLTELRDRWGRPEHGLLWSDIFRKLREVSPLPEQRAPESESVKRKPRERCSFCQKYVCEWDCPYAAPESEGT